MLKDVYCFNPAPEALTADRQRHIVGVQANLWCEYVPTFRHAQYMELPRMAALSEVKCGARKTTMTSWRACRALLHITTPWTITMPAIP